MIQKINDTGLSYVQTNYNLSELGYSFGFGFNVVAPPLARPLYFGLDTATVNAAKRVIAQNTDMPVGLLKLTYEGTYSSYLCDFSLYVTPEV